MIDGLKDLIEMYEKAFPRHGRPAALVLLVTAMLAAFAFTANVVVEYLLVPVYSIALKLIQVWPSLNIGGIILEKIWAALLTACIAGLISGTALACINWLLLSRNLRRLVRFQLRLRREFAKDKAEIADRAAELEEYRQAVIQGCAALRDSQKQDFEDFKRRWDDLDNFHKERSSELRAVSGKVRAAADLMEEANSLLGHRMKEHTASRAAPPEPQSREDIAPKTQP